MRFDNTGWPIRIPPPPPKPQQPPTTDQRKIKGEEFDTLIEFLVQSGQLNLSEFEKYKENKKLIENID